MEQDGKGSLVSPIQKAFEPGNNCVVDRYCLSWTAHDHRVDTGSGKDGS
jgi:hypothetical protein